MQAVGRAARLASGRPSDHAEDRHFDLHHDRTENEWATTYAGGADVQADE